uniref:F-box associated beta-propeller type 1 domain-containing protein n=1 Tax=Kalanchoe fedtschenkoi TaxID=63787 RepID=A0A7N0TRG3_KALFE
MGVDVKRDGHDECRIHENMSMPRFLKYGQGLVTFSAGFGMYCAWVDWDHRAALWNPATREVKELPRSPFYRHRDFSLRYTFGRVAYEDGAFSYKVGLLEREWPNLELHLYSSNTASWRLIKAPRSAFPRILPCRGVNWKDAVRSLSWDDEAEDYHIMTFDYGREEFGRIGLPDAPQLRQYETQRRAFLTLFDDQFLCLIFPWVVQEEEEREKPDMFVDVWVMRENGVEGSWSKECTKGPVSDHMSLARKYSKSLGGMFLESWERGRGVYKLISSELYLYDCASSAVENLSVCSDGWTDSRFWTVQILWFELGGRNSNGRSS